MSNYTYYHTILLCQKHIHTIVPKSAKLYLLSAKALSEQECSPHLFFSVFVILVTADSQEKWGPMRVLLNEASPKRSNEPYLGSLECTIDEFTFP